MSDICKCEGTGCPFRDSCYRYNAEPNLSEAKNRQSYFMEVPLKWFDITKIGSDDRLVASCEEYWEYPKKEKK